MKEIVLKQRDGKEVHLVEGAHYIIETKFMHPIKREEIYDKYNAVLVRIVIPNENLSVEDVLEYSNGGQASHALTVVWKTRLIFKKSDGTYRCCIAGKTLPPTITITFKEDYADILKDITCIQDLEQVPSREVLRLYKILLQENALKAKADNSNSLKLTILEHVLLYRLGAHDCSALTR
jgi:hypothetical protein